MPLTDFMFENIPCGCLTYYTDGTIISINKTLLNWMELGKEDVIGKKRFSDLLSVGGKLYYQMIIMPLLARQGSVNEINFDIAVPGGTYVPSLYNAVVLKAPGDEREVVNAVFVKITDRKKHEADLLRGKRMAEEERKRFETLCNVIPNIIWTAQPGGDISFVNSRFYEEFHVSKISNQQVDLFALFHPGDQPRMRKRWERAVLKAIPFDGEVRICCGENRYDWYLLRATPYMDEGGNISQWFGSCTNIHERRLRQQKRVESLNASLNEASQMIDERDRTLQEISYSQSHVVRKPLANILGLMQVIDTDDMTEPQQAMFDMIKQSAEELDTVIKSMIIRV
ncbi:PAS domain-containing protein [Mucilaginibacter sp. Bleaf8]|uniref:PAS domain-containing protein n=1 Tax=Mucilaginibacter sp. Bleaf8 TaxID=2834430 RepID=UPI001BCDEBA6|nr:PAS domain-containing protein [Mucilaginibacter sp. Bleaf8]MBS7563514.1 PAS domain-containing protein [Mucilaginibacter sp. Bleaf8]